MAALAWPRRPRRRQVRRKRRATTENAPRPQALRHRADAGRVGERNRHLGIWPVDSGGQEERSLDGVVGGGGEC